MSRADNAPAIYFRLDASFDDDEDVWELDPLAELVWIRSIGWSKRKRTDGFVKRSALRRIAARIDPGALDGLVANLVDVGVWVEVSDGWQIRNYSKWQITTEKEESIRSSRRKGGLTVAHRRGDHDVSPVRDCPSCSSSAQAEHQLSSSSASSSATQTQTHTHTQRTDLDVDDPAQAEHQLSSSSAQAETQDSGNMELVDLVLHSIGVKQTPQRDNLARYIERAREAGHIPDAVLDVARRHRSSDQPVQATMKALDELRKQRPTLRSDAGLAQVRQHVDVAPPPMANLKASLGRRSSDAS